jgi:aminoglycoside phosphotransferase (APT) family kinase protein
LAEREARVLSLLATTAVPAPELVAVDADGSACGAPSVLMTRLPGRVTFEPPDMESWLRQMAAALSRIHAIDRDAQAAVQPYRPYHDFAAMEPPAWSRQADVWRRSLDVVTRPPPAFDACFIHRDYHPGNVLWARGRLTGIVDWVNASWGPPGIDVGHCRLNLALLHGPDIADRFLACCEAEFGSLEGQPFWDLVAALDGGFLSHGRVYSGWTDAGVRGLTPALLRQRLEEHVARAAGRL